MKEKLFIAALISILLGALVFQAWYLGVTVDEPSHLLSAYLYWHGRDNLRPHDMPPLIKLAGGWVPRLLELPVPSDLGRPGDPRHEWQSSQAMIEHMSGDRIQTVFFLTRLTLLVFPLCTVLLIWRWGRRLFGPAAGVLAAVFFVAEPSALGHGALFKNDLAATFGYALFWFMAWKYWLRPGAAAAAAMGAAVLLAMAAKLSMLFLAGAAIVLVLACARRAGARSTALALALVTVLPYAGLMALYQFETHRLSPVQLAAAAHDPSLPAWFLAAANLFRILPLPEDLWYGCVSLFQNNSQPNAVYLLGRVYPAGTPLYFLVALAVKIPAIVQLMILGGLVAAFRRRNPADLFWLAPGFLYIALASLSSLQLGVRLVLPALPFGMLACGAAIQWLWERRRRAIPVAAAALLAVQTAAIYPHGISFINVLSGGSEKGLDYLADSNLDWGQGLPDLERFVHERGIHRFRLSYFGNDSVFRYFEEDEVELVAPPWNPDPARQTRLEPKPGYYAISATLLPGHFFQPPFRDYYAAFRNVQPVARAGDSIYIYKFGL